MFVIFSSATSPVVLGDEAKVCMVMGKMFALPFTDNFDLLSVLRHVLW
jgi:hypothetical protein